MKMDLTDEEVGIITRIREKKEYERSIRVLSLEILRVAYDYGGVAAVSPRPDVPRIHIGLRL